eukprot:2585453-Prymnesium_polylepis.1
MVEELSLDGALSEDLLQYVLEGLNLPLLGKASQVCSRWNSILSSPAPWQREVLSNGYLWQHPGELLEVANGWKRLLKHERELERRWLIPSGTGLRARVLSGGHRHWVPSVLMHVATRELVRAARRAISLSKGRAHAPPSRSTRLGPRATRCRSTLSDTAHRSRARTMGRSVSGTTRTPRARAASSG